MHNGIRLDSRSTPLKISYMVTVGTTSEDAPFKGGRNYLAFGSSAKYASRPEESTIFILYFLLFSGADTRDSGLSSLSGPFAISL
jgi:hypothetical protein